MRSKFVLNNLQWLLLLSLIFSTAFVLAQGIVTGSISGTVVDPTGAVISGANVSAQNIDTNQALNAETNQAGYFTFRSVVPGTYRVTIDAKNFRKVQVSQVVVQVAKD